MSFPCFEISMAEGKSFQNYEFKWQFCAKRSTLDHFFFDPKSVPEFSPSFRAGNSLDLWTMAITQMRKFDIHPKKGNVTSFSYSIEIGLRKQFAVNPIFQNVECIFEIIMESGVRKVTRPSARAMMNGNEDFCSCSFTFPAATKRLFMHEQCRISMTVICTLCLAVEHALSPREELSRDLVALYDNEINCDVTLNVGSREFRVHKCILAARSRVFNAMFSHNLLENSCHCVDIPDVKADVMEALIVYVYTGRMEVDSTLLNELYAAADKYAMPGLIKLCAAALMENMSVENVLDVYVSADMHHDEDLKKSAMKYVLYAKTEVLSSKKWDALIEDRNVTASEILLAILENQKNYCFKSS